MNWTDTKSCIFRRRILVFFETRVGINFCPLVTNNFFLTAELDVLFLRPQKPGELISPAGDIDNRVKTLLDGLRMPKVDEIKSGNLFPEGADDPFHCLLQDDELVTELNVRTDRLLTGNQDKSLLIVTVTLKATRLTLQNIGIVG